MPQLRSFEGHGWTVVMAQRKEGDANDEVLNDCINTLRRELSKSRREARSGNGGKPK